MEGENDQGNGDDTDDKRNYCIIHGVQVVFLNRHWRTDRVYRSKY